MKASVGKCWYSYKPKKEFPFAYSVDKLFTYDVMGENWELKNEKCLVFTGILPTTSGSQSLMPHTLTSLAIITETTGDRQGTWNISSICSGRDDLFKVSRATSGQVRWRPSTLQRFSST